MADRREERLAINTGTAGVEVGVYPARFRDRMFADPSWLALLDRHETETGRGLPVISGGVTGAGGTPNDWGDPYTEVGEGALRARKDTSYTSAKFGAFDAQYQVEVSFEQVRDTPGYSERLEARAAYLLRLFLSWRACAGTGSGQGQGVMRALEDDGDHAETLAGENPTLVEIQQLRYDTIDGAYRNHPSCAWITFDSNIRQLATLENHGEPLFSDDPRARDLGAEGFMLGRPVYAVDGCNAFAANAKGVMAFGAWECMGLRLVGGLRADSSAEVDLPNDQIRFRMSQSYDTRVLDPYGLTVINSGA